MKRFLFIMSAVLMLLSGCGQKSVLQIENHSWQAASIILTEENGTVSRTKDNLDLVCTAHDGILTMENRASGECWEGTYTLLENQNGTAIYTLSLAGEEGHAVVSETAYQDRDTVPTLVLTVEQVTLYFQD